MAKQKRIERAWYSISVAAVRRGVTLLGFIAALVVCFILYQRWQAYTLDSRALEAIREATELTELLAKREDWKEIQRDNRSAFNLLAEARVEYDKGAYDTALKHGRRCLTILKSIPEVAGSSKGKHRFLSVQGNVEYRRGRGAWRRARVDDPISPGDWVKTAAGGTAEILFADGSTYTLRQSTMVHLGGSPTESATGGGGKKATDIAFGWVELNTKEAGSTVKTPRSEARIRRSSEAMVSFDQTRGAGRFAAYEGSVEVRSATGQTRQVGALQQVEQTGDLLQEVKDLPARPKLIGPANNQEIDVDAHRELTLRWQPVNRARQYGLQVAASELFATRIIDEQRARTSARLGIRGEGSFFWRVVAIDEDGVRGPWSHPRSFRVVSLRGVGEADDQTPPELEITSTETYGALVIVNGYTEPGSTVTINGESILTEHDGSFSGTIQMNQEGYGFVEIKAKDAWQNEATQRVRVFIDAY